MTSVRDFSMVYDAYVQSEMRLLELLMDTVALRRRGDG